MSLAPTYNPKDFEDKIYQQWQSVGVGSPEKQKLLNSKPKVLFATTNSHKIKLFKIAWKHQELDKEFDLITLKDLDTASLPKVVEDSGTFEGDATLKAIAYAQHFNLPTISQDRGFVFSALNWPGTDSKKVMFGSEEIVWTSKDHWESEKISNINRAQQALDKLDGMGRGMNVIQGLAIALPNGSFVSEELVTNGSASNKIEDSIGGSFEWFFIPNSLNHILTEFENEDLLDDWSAKNMYQITSKITQFLEQNVLAPTLELGQKKDKIDNYRENVRIVLYNPQTKLYGVQKTINKNSWFPKIPSETKIYSLLGGGIESGHSLIETAKKEFIEETGYIDFDIVTILGGKVDSCFVENDTNFRRVSAGFLIKLNSMQNIGTSLEDYEKQLESECVWLEKAEIVEKLGFVSDLDPRFQTHLEFLKRGIEYVENVLENPTYSVLMPPPNLTGDLHAGHAFQHYIMDTLTRVHRQKGIPSLWYPGVDHAGIQLEGVIDKLIKKGDFDEVLNQKIPEISQIKVEDRPKWLKDTNRELWTELAWSRVNAWRDNQKKQSSVLGDTPDYSRSLFTLDDRANNMVNYAFERYWQDGLIYKSSYLINWSVGLQTALSDVAGEIEYEKRVDPFITFEYRVKKISQIQYPDVNIPSDQIPLGFEKLFDKRIKVSTVRPETIAGDVAIAIHPSKVATLFDLSEEEAKSVVSHLSDKNPSIKIYLENPINPEYITIIVADEVDPNFGTGALKITPASDIVDYDIFNKYMGGEFPSSVGRDGKLTEICGNYAGLTVEQGRLAVIKTLIQNGYVPLKPESILDTDDVKKEIENRKLELDNFDPTNYSYHEGLKRLKEILGDYIINEIAVDWNYEHNVTICERSKTVIEPLISEEFFLSYSNSIESKNNQNLQKIGLDGIKETNFYPAELADRAQNFLENIKDWCISRDLVWGHKMPIWYNLETNPNKVFYSHSDLDKFSDSQKPMKIQAQKPTESGNWVQEQKILDTWFSSCLWPLSTLGFYDYKHGKTDTDFEKYYSTTDMVTGVDIFYQWIVRMMMVCKYFTDSVPYKNVIINPTVRDEQGRKMSKSLGNGLDAVAQIDKFSSDSLRLAMLSGMIPNRNFRLGGKIADKMCEKYRNFGNKLWNVARFLESR